MKCTELMTKLLAFDKAERDTRQAIKDFELCVAVGIIGLLLFIGLLAVMTVTR